MINFPADVQAGEPFEVSGYLLYKAKEYTNQNGETVLRGWISPIDASLSSSYREVALPLSFKKVMVSINGTSSDQELITDGKGYFQTTVQINKKPNWPLLIHAEYLGEERITNYPGTSKLSLKTCPMRLPSRERKIQLMEWEELLICHQ